jgi:hypothetical protein
MLAAAVAGAMGGVEKNHGHDASRATGTDTGNTSADPGTGCAEQATYVPVN